MSTLPQWARQLQGDVSADASCLCDKAALYRYSINGTPVSIGAKNTWYFEHTLYWRITTTYIHNLRGSCHLWDNYVHQCDKMRTCWSCHSAADIHDDTEVSYCSNYTKILPASLTALYRYNKHAMYCTYNVTLRDVHTAIVAVEMQ